MAVFLLLVLVPLVAAKQSKFEFPTIAQYQPLTDVRDHVRRDSFRFVPSRECLTLVALPLLFPTAPC
jgi:hypothetical protein